jgi:O-glycosyl hydrolase
MFVLTVAIPSRPAMATQVTTNFENRAQTIEGFGTALPWFRDDRFGGSTNYNTDAFADLYFDDLGASTLRLELQYTVFNETGGINPSNDQMDEPIRLGSNTYNNLAKFNFDANGVGHIKNFVRDYADRAQDDLTLFGSLWSPPHWMKTGERDWLSGNVIDASKPTWRPILDSDGNKLGEVTANSQGGTLIDTPDNLEQFGRYVTAWLKGWEQNAGRPLDALSIQNEMVFSELYNSAVYTPELYVKALNAVDDAIAEHNLTFPNDPIRTRLQGPEDVGVGPEGDLGILWRQFQFIEAIRNDPQASEAMDIWSTHGDVGFGVNFDNPRPGRTQNWRYWRDGRQNVQDNLWAQWDGVGDDPHPTWQTERSGEFDAWVTQDRAAQNGALALGVRVHDALTAGDVTLFNYWLTQLEDDDDQPLRTDALTNSNNPDKPKFAAFRHFTKHIRPGAQRIDVGSDDDQLLASGFLHEDNDTLTYVLLNIDDAGDSVTLDLPEAFEARSVAAWLSQEGSYHVPQSLDLTGKGTSLSVFLPRESMMTLVFSALVSQLVGDFDGDGQVAQADLNLVLQNWGLSGTPDGWISGGPEGFVGQEELNLVLQNWGASQYPDLSGLPVPEPSVAAVLLVGVAGLGRRRTVQA